MGWSSGSRLLSIIVDEIEEIISSRSDRVEIYKIVISAFKDFDCDVIHECITDQTNAFAEAFYTLHPCWRDDEY